MSADNWSQCPNCLIKFEQDKAFRLRRARLDCDQAYGKLPAAEYEKLRQVLFGIEAEELDQDNTVREDCEFYLDPETGAWFASYKCWCNTCDFKHNFHHSEDIPLPDECKP